MREARAPARVGAPAWRTKFRRQPQAPKFILYEYRNVKNTTTVYSSLLCRDKLGHFGGKPVPAFRGHFPCELLLLLGVIGTRGGFVLLLRALLAGDLLHRCGEHFEALRLSPM